MSLKKKREEKELDAFMDLEPMFEVDPVTGKLKALPLKFLSNGDLSSVSSSVSKRKRVQPFIPFMELKPLREMDLDFGDADEAAPKKAKTSNSVRKGLFNNVKRDSKVPRLSFRGQKKTSIAATSVRPLVNMEKLEKELCQKGSIRDLPFQSPARLLSQALGEMELDTSSASLARSQSTLSLHNKIPKITIQEQDKSKSLLDISTETTDNPNLTSNDQSQLISDILIRHRLAFEQFETEYESSVLKISELLESQKKAFKRYKKIHETTIKSLSSLIDSNGDTPPRRNSVRLQTKISTPKCIGSPKIEKGTSLLRSLLKKKFTDTQKQDSPRTKKAMDLYNSTMIINDIKILDTPKINGTTHLRTPKSQGMKNLSMKIQKQCLLLQDTPR